MSSNPTIGLDAPFENSAAVDEKPSFLARWYGNFIKSQTARGERRAAAHMRTLSPTLLASLGLTTEEIAKVRQTGKLPASYWARQ